MSNSVTYGAAFADVYDAWYGDSDDLDSVVNLLCESRPQRVLELGVGTGRIALALAEQLSATEPLNANVIHIHGIDESPEMLAHLRTKDVRQRITCHLGDMARNQPPGPFDLVFASYNTLFNLTSSPLQAECHVAQVGGNPSLCILGVETSEHFGRLVDAGHVYRTGRGLLHRC